VGRGGEGKEEEGKRMGEKGNEIGGERRGEEKK
jgi:hypothetical protein